MKYAVYIRFSYAPTLASSKEMLWHHFGAINVWRFFFLSFFFVILILFSRHRRYETHFHFAFIYRMQYVTGKYKYEIFAHHKEGVTLLHEFTGFNYYYLLFIRKEKVSHWKSSFIVLDLHTIKWEWASSKRKCLILLDSIFDCTTLDKQCIPYLNCCKFSVSVK